MSTSHFELLRSLETSEQEAVEASVVGLMPEWLHGTLFKNGTGRYAYGAKCYKHFFDGHACIHKFKIERGTNKVFYSNRMLKTKAYTRSLAEQRLYPVFGTVDLCSNVFGRLKTVFNFHETMDNVNVNVVPFGNNQMYALTESNYICQIDPINLSVIRTIDVAKQIPTVSTNTAHPHQDENGWLMCGINSRRGRLCYEFLRYPQRSVDAVETGPGSICSRAYTVGRIQSHHFTKLSYFHSFGITANYIIFLEQSLLLDLTKFFFGLFTNKTFADALVMKPEMNTRIHLIERQTSRPIKVKFHTCPLFLFHHINAYETMKTTTTTTTATNENDNENEENQKELVIDIIAYDPNHFDIKLLTYEDMFTERLCMSDKIKSLAKRIRVPLLNLNQISPKKSIYCPIEDLCPLLAFELPVINYARFNGLPYKYVYGLNFYKRPFSIVKVNVSERGEWREKSYDKEMECKCLPSEPVFVPRPNGECEDDGVLLVIVLTEKNDFLSVLNAKDLSEIARANIEPNVKASLTFHGFFADDSKYKTLNE